MGVHSGKGSPEEIAIALHLVSRYKLYDKIYATDPAAGVRDYCDRYIGLDCNGFVGNYARAIGKAKVPNTPIGSYAPDKARRTRIEDVQANDVLVWPDFGHIAVIHSIEQLSTGPDGKPARDCVVVESTGREPVGRVQDTRTAGSSTRPTRSGRSARTRLASSTSLLNEMISTDTPTTCRDSHSRETPPSSAGRGAGDPPRKRNRPGVWPRDGAGLGSRFGRGWVQAIGRREDATGPRSHAASDRDGDRRVGGLSGSAGSANTSDAPLPPVAPAVVTVLSDGGVYASAAAMLTV